MNLNTIYRKHLRGSDLDKPVTVEIVAFHMLTFHPRPTEAQEKLCMFVKGLPKDMPTGVIVGPELCKSLVKLFGQAETDKLIGRKIVLFAQDVKVGNVQKKAIRFRLPKNGDIPQPPQPAPDEHLEADYEDISNIDF